jgi:hypothetical protein
MVLKLAFTEEGKSLKRTCSMCLHNKAGRERERERERETGDAFALEFKTLYTALSSYEFVDRQMQNRQFI